MAKRSGSTGKTRIDDPQAWLEEVQRELADYYGPQMDGQPAFDPLKVMAFAAADPATSIQARAKVSRDLAEFLFAKKRAVEVDGDLGNDFMVQIVYHGEDGQLKQAKAEAIEHGEPERLAPPKFSEDELAVMLGYGDKEGQS